MCGCSRGLKVDNISTILTAWRIHRLFVSLFDLAAVGQVAHDIVSLPDRFVAEEAPTGRRRLRCFARFSRAKIKQGIIELSSSAHKILGLIIGF